MNPRGGPYRELTNPENVPVTQTLTPRGWRKFAALDARRAFYARPASEAPRPSDVLLETARRSSGAVRGEHRKDLVEAIKGQAMLPGGLAVNLGSTPATSPVGEVERKERRVW